MSASRGDADDAKMKPTATALEFYSGIGGWSEALEIARERLPIELQDIEVGR